MSHVSRRQGIFVSVVVGLFLLVPVLSSLAAPPPDSRSQLTFQARLTTPTGQPVNGQVSLTFKIYDVPADGSASWSESQITTAVNGIVSVVLGQTNPLDPALLDPSGADRYVAVVLAGTEVTRVKLTASAYAVSAASAAGVWDPIAGTTVNMAGLDLRFVKTNGTSGGVVRTINSVQPSAATGDFTVSPGPSGRVTVSTTTNGVVIETTPPPPSGVQTINGVAADSGTNDFTVAAGPSGRVTVTPTTAGLEVETAPTVAALNGQTGAVSVVAGTNVTLASGPGTITINASSYTLPDPLNVSQLGASTILGTTIHTSHMTSETLQVNQQLTAVNNFSAFNASIQNATIQNLLVPGDKGFAAPHPLDPTKMIVYCSLEGPEWGLYSRGSATLVNGVATISTPEHFNVLALADSITVQLTPTGDCRGLYVASKSPTTVVVRECQGGTSAATFDYLILGSRKHRAEDDIVRPRPSGQ